MSGSSRKASSPSWRARSRRRSRSCGSSRDAACRQPARVAVRSRAASSASPATAGRRAARARPSRRSSPPRRPRRPSAPSGRAGARRPRSGTRARRRARRSPAGPRGPGRGRGHRAAAAPAGRGCRRRRARSRRCPCAAAVPRALLGGGVPATASASRPASQASTASTRSARLSPAVPACRARVPLVDASRPGSGSPLTPADGRTRCRARRRPRSPVRTRTISSIVVDPDLAVTDLAGRGGLDDGVDDAGGVELARRRPRCGPSARSRPGTPRRGRPRCARAAGRSPGPR